MNHYTRLSSGVGTEEAMALNGRLTAWHDAMVAHERRLRAGVSTESCDDDCPHAEAPALWFDAVSIFGSDAEELTFLSSRAGESRRRRGRQSGGASMAAPHARSAVAPTECER